MVVCLLLDVLCLRFLVGSDTDWLHQADHLLGNVRVLGKASVLVPFSGWLVGDMV